jgi:hypothetical protein
MAEPTASQQQAMMSMVISVQQMVSYNAEFQALVLQKRTPYLIAVQTAIHPEQRALMQAALEDFDREQMAPVILAYKQKMKAALQQVMDCAPELMTFFD